MARDCPTCSPKRTTGPTCARTIGHAGDIGAQIVFAVREEMALTLADVVMRRTCIGQTRSTQSRRCAGDGIADHGRRTRLERGTPRARNRTPSRIPSHTRGRMTAFVVVNPRSANGRTGREWKRIERALGATPIRTCRSASRASKAKQPALVRVRAARRPSRDRRRRRRRHDQRSRQRNVRCQRPHSAGCGVRFVTSGTGGDFRKTFNIEPGTEAAIERSEARARARASISARCRCLSTKAASPRCAISSISHHSAFPASIVDSVNRARIAKLFGGSFAFAFHSALTCCAIATGACASWSTG